MNVAFISNYAELYGANRSLLDMMEGLKNYGVNPVVIAPTRGKFTERLHAQNIPVNVSPIQGWVGEIYKPRGKLVHDLFMKTYYRLRPARRLYLNLKLVAPLVATLREQQVDLIHSNSSVIPIGVLLAKKLQVPHVWHFREMVDLHYGYREDWCFGLTKLVMNSSDSIVLISNTLQQHKKKYLRQDKGQVIYDGVALRKKFDHYYNLNKSFTPRESPPKFAIVGLVHPSKGHEEAVRAVAEVVKIYPATRLLIVGGFFGDFEHTLKKLIASLGVANNVEFWGEVDNPYLAYEEALATLVCSRHEALGRVTVESMAACRPVIGRNCGATAELIAHEKTGLLYEDGHANLAQQMIRIIENQQWAHRLALNGWRFARHNFTIERHAEKMYSVFEKAYYTHLATKFS